VRAVGERFGIGWGSKETGHQENRGLGCRLPQTWGPGGEVRGSGERDFWRCREKLRIDKAL